ncbi:MAG: zf-HC2 domain-containing protein [Acidimicrobiales bacterium]
MSDPFELRRRLRGLRTPGVASCHEVREALSARLDGEAVLVTRAALDAHLESCGECAEFETSVTFLLPRVGLRLTRRVPDDFYKVLAGRSGVDLRKRAGPIERLRGVRQPSRRLFPAKLLAAVAPAAAAVTALPLGLSVHSDVTPTHVRTPCTIWLHDRGLR